MKFLFIFLAFFTGLGDLVQSTKTYPGNFLEHEAGISAYFEFSGPTNLKSNLLQNLFRTISIESDQYLIGFVPVEGLESGTNQDVKVFIHNDGWVVAYYMADNPTSKIFKEGTEITRLERTLERIAEAIEVTDYQVRYWSFQNPQAEKVLVMRLKAMNGTERMDFRLPGENTYYERSWYMSAWNILGSGRFVLDGREVAKHYSGLIYNFIDEKNLVPDAKHVVELTGSWSGAELVMTVLYQGNETIVVNDADSISFIDLSPIPDGLKLAASEVPFYLQTFLPFTVR